MGKTRGRPVKAPENRRSSQVTVQLTEAEWRMLVEEARLEGVSLSQYARRRLLP